MRLLLYGILCGALGCTGSAERLQLLERREANLIREIEVLQRETESIEADVTKARVAATLTGDADAKAQLDAVQARVDATVDASRLKQAELSERLEAVSAEISSLVD